MAEEPAAARLEEVVEEDAWIRKQEEIASFLFARNQFLEEQAKEHDMYEGEDASTKMMHLIHSDTMTVVVALVVMIIVGLVFRSLCLRLTRDKSRKERMRGGLKALADHMHSVTRAMSNDLEQPHDSPRAVMRTYSNYGRGKAGAAATEEAARVEHGAASGGGKHPNFRTMSRENLRVQAFSNVLAQEKVCQDAPPAPSPAPSPARSLQPPPQVSIEMAAASPRAR